MTENCSSLITHHSSPVLLVDDEQQTLDSFSLALRSAGIENIKTINDSREAMPFVLKHGASVIILDLYMPYISGVELLNQIRNNVANIPVIIMTASNDIETAIECMKNGAFDYLVKPVEKGRFVSSIKKALVINELREEVNILKGYLLSGKLKHEDAFSSLITRSPRMFTVFQYVEAVAESQQPLLITGETGVGKELIAKAVHTLSGRKGNLTAVNVSGLDDAMFSDTLFGHEKGAFTGAEKQRQGMILQAEGGTLLLDEIGELSEPSQVKLLRLMEEQVYYPLGSDILRKSDSRVITATNKNHKELLSEKKFRKDLYYRLCTHYIHIPPLRERLEDIPLLIDFFLEEAAKSMSKKKPTPPPELFTLLSAYSFPGNTRELRAMIFDAVARHESGILSMNSFKDAMKHEPSILQPAVSPSPDKAIQLYCSFSGFPTLKEIEDYFVKEALKRSKGNRSIAASLLGITRQGLYKRLSKSDK